MDPNCIIPVAANCRDSKTETDVCFKVTATGAILHGSVTLEFDCENGGALTGKTFTSDAGTEYSSEDAVEVGCPPLVMTIPMAGVTSGGGGGLTNEELRSAPLHTVVMGSPGLTDTQLRANPVVISNPVLFDISGRIGANTSPMAEGDTGGDANINSRIQRLTFRTTQIAAKLPSVIGQRDATDSLSVTMAPNSAPLTVSVSNQTPDTSGLIGSVDSPMAEEDTGVNGSLNGRLQRIAFRLGQLVSLFPASIGLKNVAGSLSVAIAPDNAVAMRAISTAGGTVAKVLSVAGTNATLVKASTANILGWHLTNLSATPKFVKVYGKATAPVAGTDIPRFVIALPADGLSTSSFVPGKASTTGFGYTIVNGVADSDATAVAAGDVVGSFVYV